jgi:hypothetical protein
VITDLIVKMQRRAKNIFILKTFFVAFCRGVFHIILERRMRERLRERHGRIFFSSRAPLLWFSAEPEIGRRVRRRRSDRRRFISIHPLREHRVIPSSWSELRYSTNGRRTMAASAAASASRRFTLVYGCFENSLRECKKVQFSATYTRSETGRPWRDERSVSPTRADASEMGRACSSDSKSVAPPRTPNLALRNGGVVHYV